MLPRSPCLSRARYNAEMHDADLLAEELEDLEEQNHSQKKGGKISK